MPDIYDESGTIIGSTADDVREPHPIECDRPRAGCLCDRLDDKASQSCKVAWKCYVCGKTYGERAV